MDDLLASIRKIIADDGADRPRPAAKVTPPLQREPHPPRRGPEVDPDLSAMVERSMLDAFGVVDAEPEEQRAPRRVEAARDRKDDPGIEAAVHSIAEAIAAERQGRSRRPQPEADRGDWSGDVLGEPGLDAGPPQRSVPWSATAASAAPKGAGAQAAGLRPRPGAPVRPEPAMPGKADLRNEPGPAGPLPHNVVRLESGERASDPSDATVNPKPQGGEGGAFRHKASLRTEGDDGLTSARTRHSVSSQLDQLSRTILTNSPRTLEDLVRDMIRPLLREWLDANLPGIVERQVRQEIDRMSTRER